jgi:hypothetical protein
MVHSDGLGVRMPQASIVGYDPAVFLTSASAMARLPFHRGGGENAERRGEFPDTAAVDDQPLTTK